MAISDVQDILNNITGIPTLTVNVNSRYYSGDLTVIDLSWYSPYKTYGDYVITGFIYIFYLWRLFIKLPSVISGAGGGIETVNKLSKLG